MLRFGLIGAGRHGERYLRHLAAGDVEGASITAFFRRDLEKAETLAEATGIPFERTLEALLRRRDVDALIAAVPAGLHETVALAVAAHHKPLLLEKPLAPTVREGRNIVEAFAPRELMVAQTLRFDPLVEALRAAHLSEGTVRGFSFEQRLDPRGLLWEDHPSISGGGVLLQTAIHTADALRFVLRPANVEVLAAVKDSVEYQNNEDHASLILRTGEALGTLSASKIGQARTLRFALYLDRCMVEADLIFRTLTTVRGKERQIQNVAERPTVVAAARAFVQTVNGERENPITGEDALASLQIVETAYQLTGGRSTNPASRSR